MLAKPPDSIEFVGDTITDRVIDDTSGSISGLESPDTLNSTPESSESETDYALYLDLDLEQVDESLASTIIQEIEEGVYVCLVCTCEIDRLSQIWSCLGCYRVYDLDCIRNWATRSSSTTAQRTWRCPACYLEHNKIPQRFTCWCGRKTNPSPNSLIPFSCGNACDHKYESCIHSCFAQCHPGEHPTCGAMGPLMMCKCGAESQQLPCLMTPYEDGWKCQTPCEIIVCAMGHRCAQKSCHDGLCGPCSAIVTVQCYCGHETIETECHKINPKLGRSEDGLMIVGGVSCNRAVRSFYDCEIHFEDVPCQAIPQEKPHCKFAPDVVKSCFCGKIAQDNVNRQSCTDPMPECNNPCGKLLNCGCICKAQCHPGPCECISSQVVKCSCKNTEFLVPCTALEQGFEPLCLHKCAALLSCRKHVHKSVCCSYEQSALKRESDDKRLIRNNLRFNFAEQLLTMEPCHICTRDCNQLLKCGKHRCKALCHSGPCGVCLESSADDLVCNCGKTVIPAPVRCGTEITCTETCLRPLPCGHTSIPHQCHDDDVSCPKCTHFVTKWCECGLKEVKTALCSAQTVSCGNLCVVRKECGHTCNRACLKECSNGIHASVAQCPFQCCKIRKSCPHMCTLKCHQAKNTNCDSVVCSLSVVLTCMCGNLEKKVACGASETQETAIGRCIPCDDECGVKAREKELRAAFNVALPSEPVYSDEVLAVYRRQQKWCRQKELQLLQFISNYMLAAELKPTKSLHFPAMSKPQADFVHNLCDSFKLYSESYGQELNPGVFVHITERTIEPRVRIEQALASAEEVARRAEFMVEMRQKKLNEGFHNAVLITDVFFGISKDDVERKVQQILTEFPEIEQFSVLWIKDSTYAFTSAYFAGMDKEKENLLCRILNQFKRMLRDDLIAFDCRMCLLDDDMCHDLQVDNANVMK